jgi:hypothetical protein
VDIAQSVVTANQVFSMIGMRKSVQEVA